MTSFSLLINGGQSRLLVRDPNGFVHVPDVVTGDNVRDLVVSILLLCKEPPVEFEEQVLATATGSGAVSRCKTAQTSVDNPILTEFTCTSHSRFEDGIRLRRLEERIRRRGTLDKLPDAAWLRTDCARKKQLGGFPQFTSPLSFVRYGRDETWDLCAI